jgi:hypothetical protein
VCLDYLAVSSNSIEEFFQVKECAAKAAGFLCIGEEFPHSRDIIQGFLDMAKEVSFILCILFLELLVIHLK